MPHSEHIPTPEAERLIDRVYASRTAAGRHRANIDLIEYHIKVSLLKRGGPALTRANATIENLRAQIDAAAKRDVRA